MRQMNVLIQVGDIVVVDPSDKQGVLVVVLAGVTVIGASLLYAFFGF